MATEKLPDPMEERTLQTPLKEKDGIPPLDQARANKTVRLGDADEQEDSRMEIDESNLHHEGNASQGTGMDSSIPQPQPPLSFKDMLVSGGQNCFREDEEIELQEDDVTYTCKVGIPTVSFSTRVKEILNRSMEFAVVIKLLGRRICYNTLRDKLPYLWKTTSPYKLIDCAGDCYIVKFSTHEDYQWPFLVALG